MEEVWCRMSPKYKIYIRNLKKAYKKNNKKNVVSLFPVLQTYYYC